MRRAVEGLAQQPQIVLVDGNQRPQLAMPVRTVIGGDAKVRAISAASIIAKVHRDRLCLQLHDEHPQYGFDSHKGYSTPEHLERAARARRLPAPPAQLRAGPQRPRPACSERAPWPRSRRSRRGAIRCSCGCSKLADDGAAYRQLGAVLLEGEHLCAALAARARPAPVLQAIVSDAALGASRACAQLAAGGRAEVAIVDAALLAQLGTLESPAPIVFLVAAAPSAPTIDAGAPTRRPRPRPGSRQRRQRPAQRRRVRLRAR